eukprot:CAMPEP_0173427644 /NCGR_PEP_ID=MMETSP1357-20121228/6797_1 /TAXON_ID=77926 /ORGANISM="Hemiselmis rufescens, Strain PCC563" /LENGTH=115 /DNA_ID=CAMNT_0014391527 /DNA_START=38 /DNA_END=385 /DNA_ORIENTATION=-
MALALGCAASYHHRQQQGNELFQRSSDPSLDADSWTMKGILGDNIDGSGNPFKLSREGAGQAGMRKQQSLLGGDDWLGAPLAVPEDTREQGEQQVGQNVDYWLNHDGNIGVPTGR